MWAAAGCGTTHRLQRKAAQPPGSRRTSGAPQPVPALAHPASAPCGCSRLSTAPSKGCTSWLWYSTSASSTTRQECSVVGWSATRSVQSRRRAVKAGAVRPFSSPLRCRCATTCGARVAGGAHRAGRIQERRAGAAAGWRATAACPKCGTASRRSARRVSAGLSTARLAPPQLPAAAPQPAHLLDVVRGQHPRPQLGGQQAGQAHACGHSTA